MQYKEKVLQALKELEEATKDKDGNTRPEWKEVRKTVENTEDESKLFRMYREVIELIAREREEQPPPLKVKMTDGSVKDFKDLQEFDNWYQKQPEKNT